VEQPPERPLKWWDKVDEELANPQTSASAVPDLVSRHDSNYGAVLWRSVLLLVGAGSR
jgi:hypothetical protein